MRFISLSVIYLLYNSVSSVNGKPNFFQFLSDLPTKMSDAFSGFWSRMVSEVRKPVKLKRLGQRRKTTNHAMSETTEISKIDRSKNVSDNYIKVTTVPKRTTTFKREFASKIVLPMIAKPSWRTFIEFQKLIEEQSWEKLKEKENIVNARRKYNST